MKESDHQNLPKHNSGVPHVIGVTSFHMNLNQSQKLLQPGQQLNPFGFDDDDEMPMSMDEGKSSNFSRMSEGAYGGHHGSKQKLSNKEFPQIQAMSSTIGSGVQNGRPSILNENQNMNVANRRSELLQGTPASRYFQRAQDHQSNGENTPKRLPFDESNSSDFSRGQQAALDQVEVADVSSTADHPLLRHNNLDINGPNHPISVSDRSSRLFDVASSSTNNQHMANGRSIQKVTNIRDLMRIFRININDDGTFEVNGQPYVLDLDELKQPPFVGNDDGNSEYTYRDQESGCFPTPQEKTSSDQMPRMDFPSRATFGNVVESKQKQLIKVIPIVDHADKLEEVAAQGFGRLSQLAMDRWLLEDQSPPASSNKRNNINHNRLPGLQTLNDQDLGDDNVINLESNEIMFKKYQNFKNLIDKEIQVKETDFSPFAGKSPHDGSQQFHFKSPFLAKETSNPMSQSSILSKFAQPLQKSNSNLSGQESALIAKNTFYNYQEVQAQMAEELKRELVEKGGIHQLIGNGQASAPPIAMAKSVHLVNEDTFLQTREQFKQKVMMKNDSLQKMKLNVGASFKTSNTINELYSPMFKRNLSMGDDTSFGLQKGVTNYLEQFQKSQNDKLQLLEQQNMVLQKQLEENKCVKENHDHNNIKEPPHLLFLFATPLVVYKGSPAINQPFKEQYKPQALLEFKREFKEIKRSLKETGKHIRICSMQATVENFTKVLGQRPLAMHFTGHGLQYKTPGGLQKKLLMLEHFDGVSEEMTEEQLSKLIKNTNVQLDFVFVASCNSEFAGRIFQKIGVKHVIVVKQGNNIADEAVILFSKTFYNLVFGGSNTVCASFRSAKNAVEVRYGFNESDKFTILTNTDMVNAKLREEAAKRASVVQIPQSVVKKPGKKGKKYNNMPDIDDDEEFNIKLDPTIFGFSNPLILFQDPNPNESKQEPMIDSFKETPHECQIFGPFEKGLLESLDEEPFFREIPSHVENFIGRQIELFEVIHTIMRFRLVNIMGLPGIGKTALAKNAVHYMLDRRLFKLGIIFFSCKGYKNSNVFMKKLVSNIIINNLDLNPEQKAKISDGNQEALTNMIINYFKKQDDHLLVVFDNAEDLIYRDREEFRKLVTELLQNCPSLKFLITSRVCLGLLQDIDEKIILLQELEPKYSVKLFLSRARHIDFNEKYELLNYKPQDKMLVGGEEGHLNQTELETSLEKHHLFKILAGNPHAIILAAPLLHKKSLKELYMLLNSDSLTECLAIDGVTDSTVASLILSIEASVSILQKEDEYALQFFYMIGLLPGGIFQAELKDIWKKQSEADKGYEEHVKTLMNLSLLQLKEQAGDRKQSKLILPPFINNYAEQTIDPLLKTRFQTTLCSHYVKLLQEIFREDFKLWSQDYKKEQTGESPEDSSPRPEAPDFNQMDLAFIKEQRKKMIKHETNIWACIYRMSKTELPIQFDELDFDSLHQALNDFPAMRRKSIQTPKNNHLTPRFHIKRYRKNSNSDALLDDVIQVQELQLSEKSKSVNDPNQLLMKAKKPKQVQFALDDDELNPSVADEEPHQRLSQQIDFSQMIRKPTFTKSKHNFTMVSIPEEEKFNTSVTSSSSLDKDDFEKIEKPVEIGASTAIQAELMPQKQPVSKSNLLRKIMNPIIETIMRNSIVTFKRSSTVMNKPQTVVQESKERLDEDEQDDMRIPTIAKQDHDDNIYLPQQSRSLHDALPFFSNLQPCQSTPDQVFARPSQSMTDPEKLIVYYSMILYLHKDNENALNLLSRYAKDIKGGVIYQANVQRILGLILQTKDDTVNEAMDAFQKAEKLYNQANSHYGKALSRYSMGLILQTKNAQLHKQPVSYFAIQSENSNLMSALGNFNVALQLFSDDLNHKFGMSLCHEHLYQIYKSLGNIEKADYHATLKVSLNTQFRRYIEKSRNHCPCVSRQYQDISLMTEIVKDNENRDLFPEVASTTSLSQMNSSLKMEKLRSKQSSTDDSTVSQMVGGHSAQPLSLKHQSLISDGYSPLQLVSHQPLKTSSHSFNNLIQPFDFNGTNLYGSDSTNFESPQDPPKLQMQKSLNMVPLHVVPEEEDCTQEISKINQEKSPIRNQNQTANPNHEKSDGSGGRNQESKSPGGFIGGIFSKTKSKLVESQDRKYEGGSKSPLISDQKRLSFANFGQMGINLFKKIGDATRQRKYTM